MSDKPTTQDLILLEVRDLTASQNEMRLGLNAMAEKFRALEKRVKKLEADCRYVEVEGPKTIPAEWRDTPHQKFFNASEVEEYGHTSDNLIGEDAGAK